jgi:hypothetical protein
VGAARLSARHARVSACVIALALSIAAAQAPDTMPPEQDFPISVEFRRVELLNLSGCMNGAAANYRAHHVYQPRDSCRY